MTADAPQPSAAPRRAHLAVVLAAGAVALVVAVAFQPPVLSDDAAINLRYAARAADGHGLTWDDHETVQGFSNPLHQLLLAGAAGAGLDPVLAAELLAAATLVAAVALAADLAVRLRGAGAAAIAVALLLAPTFWTAQVWTGLEVGLACALGLAAIRAAVLRQPVWCGALVAAAVLTKPDALLLAGVLWAAWTWSDRQMRWAPLAGAVAACAGWGLVATAAYGSPLPRSFTEKLGDAGALDPLWPLDPIGRGWLFPVVALAAAGTAVAVRAASGSRVGGAALAGWAGTALIAAAVVDLGDRSPWYLAPALPPLAVLAGVGGAWGLGAVRAAAGNAPTSPARAVAGAVLTLSLLVAGGSASRELADRITEDEQPDYLLLELDRREAGRMVASLAEEDEVVQTCFGWVAYEALDQPVDDPCQLNTETPPGPAVWSVVTGADRRGPGRVPQVPEGFRAVALADDACRERPGLTWYVVVVAVGTDADRRSPAPAPPCT